MIGQCLTCDEDGWAGSCHYWGGACSDDLRYCLLYCNGPEIPFTLCVSYEEGSFAPGYFDIAFVVKYTFISVIYFERNEVLREAIEPFDLPTVEEVTIPSTEPG